MATYDLAALARAALSQTTLGADGSKRNAFGNAIGEDPRYPTASMVILPTGEGKYLTAEGVEVPYPGVGHQDAPKPPAGVVSSVAPRAGTTQGGVQGAPDDQPYEYVKNLLPPGLTDIASPVPVDTLHAASRTIGTPINPDVIAQIRDALARFLGGQRPARANAFSQPGGVARANEGL